MPAPYSQNDRERVSERWKMKRKNGKVAELKFEVRRIFFVRLLSLFSVFIRHRIRDGNSGDQEMKNPTATQAQMDEYYAKLTEFTRALTYQIEIAKKLRSELQSLPGCGP